MPAKLGFPISLDSTQFEGMIPHLVDAIGYDVPLNLRLMNNGAPRFVFHKNNMIIDLSVIAEVYNDKWSEQFFEVHFNHFKIDFDMSLNGADGNQTLDVVWKKISMADA